jgi:hypothetical protein
MILTESNFNEVQILQESRSEGKAPSWYIQGVFLQADVVNRNRRIYPKNIMESEVARYTNDYVRTNRAVGELSHPDSPAVNLDKITHIIEDIRQEGTDFIGKARILGTPCGSIVAALLEGGVQLGVSSRGSGSVRSDKQGISVVQKDYSMKAIDIVYSPSAPAAFVEGLMESDRIWDTICEDVEFVEALKGDIRAASTVQLMEAKMKAFQKLIAHIRAK